MLTSEIPTPIFERLDSGNRIILRLREWTTYEPEKYPKLKGLKIEENEDIKKIIVELNKSQQLIIREMRAGLYIKTKDTVGFIQLGNFEIIIEPKIDKLQLLVLMAYVFELHQFEFKELTYFKFESFGFMELLIYQLKQEIMYLYKSGLYRSYIKIKEDTSIIKGKINLKKIINQGGIHKAKIPCILYERSVNNIFNQLLLSSLYLGINLSRQYEIKKELYHLVNGLKAEIDIISLNHEIFKKVNTKLNRLTRNYNPVVKLANFLWKQWLPNATGVLGELELPGFLFNMSQFFEDLIYKFLDESLFNYDIIHQYKFSNMLAYKKQFNPRNRRKITLKPDYAILKENTPISILDAKYRDLWEKSIPIKWLYQLGIYALNPISKKKSIILYPSINSNASDQKIEIRNPINNNQIALLTIRPVNILKLIDLITKNKTKEKFLFAKYLIRD